MIPFIYSFIFCKFETTPGLNFLIVVEWVTLQFSFFTHFFTQFFELDLFETTLDTFIIKSNWTLLNNFCAIELDILQINMAAFYRDIDSENGGTIFAQGKFDMTFFGIPKIHLPL